MRHHLHYDHHVYLLINMHQQGPFIVKEVREMLRRGEITDQQLAWLPGKHHWMPLSLLGITNENDLAKPPDPNPHGLGKREREAGIRNALKMGSII